MKKSVLVAAVATSSPQAGSAVRSTKPAGHALAFFDWLQLPGVPASEAGPAAIVCSGYLNQVDAAIESFRVAAGLPSRLTTGGKAKISGSVVRLPREEVSDECVDRAGEKLNSDPALRALTQQDADRAWGRKFQIYDGGKRDLGPILRSAVRGKNGRGKKLERGSVLIIQHVEEWGDIDLSPENLGHMLAAIYGRGAVYYSDAIEVQAPKRRLRKPIEKQDEKLPFDTNSDPDDDLPGDEWKRGGAK